MSSVMDGRKHQIDWYEASFRDFEKNLNGEAGTEFHRMRRRALDRFGETGFPTTRHEEWRFTNIRPIAETPFRPVTSVRSLPTEHAVRPFFFGTPHRLVFVDGHFVPSLSFVKDLPKGVAAGSLREAFRTENPDVVTHWSRLARDANDPFVALNTAFVHDGALVSVPENILLSDSIHILYVATGQQDSLITPRNLLIVGKGSQLSLVESYVSLKDARYLTNAVTELVAGDGAVVEHDKLQMDSLEAFHVSAIHSSQGRSSTVTSNSIVLGGSIVRNNVTSALDGEGGECTLNGLSLGTGNQLIDNHTTIDHAQPHCLSHELYKSILDGRSHGVFNGKIFVRKDAQKTNAKQTNKTLLLSDNAHIDTKPQLEIFADDVKCTHGATVGQLDADQIFYLRTRGLDQTAAQDILTFAFAADVVERVHVEPLRRQLEGLVHGKLDEGRLLS